ncbi:MAG: hypothetical protein IJZ92_03240 [Bacteroidaceae bacterium]|nr:hypothetical protein [Bacteroidaceae bacterium]
MEKQACHYCAQSGKYVPECCENSAIFCCLVGGFSDIVLRKRNFGEQKSTVLAENFTSTAEKSASTADFPACGGRISMFFVKRGQNVVKCLQNIEKEHIFAA